MSLSLRLWSRQDKITYIKMTPEKALEVVEQHLVRGQVVTKYT